MITILGAGGAIGVELAKLLAASTQPFRLVGRNPRGAPGATATVAADMTDLDQTIRAVAGSTVVHLLVGVKYDHEIWRKAWLRVMSNIIEACKRAGAKLVFFDNVYMYGRATGPGRQYLGRADLRHLERHPVLVGHCGHWQQQRRHHRPVDVL